MKSAPISPGMQAADPANLPTDPAQLALYRALEKRLVSRATADGVVYTLDLRQARFKLLDTPRLTVRYPGAPGWPHRGPTTDNLHQAKEWVAERYVTWIGNQFKIAQTAPGAASLTVREAAQRLVDSYVKIERLRDGTIVERIPKHKQSRVSMLRRNVIPALGHMLLTQLDPETVGPIIDKLQIRKRVIPGKVVKMPAEYGTKRNFKAALSEVWRSVHKYRGAPFASVQIERPDVLSAESQEVDGFEDENWLDDDRTGALDTEQLTRVLVAAMYSDRELMSRANTQGMMIPNTAHAIALQVALGPRISEELNIRWGHIYDAGYVVIHNAKRKQVGVKCRAVPKQHSVDPWLEELRAMEGGTVDANWFVIRTNPTGNKRKPGAQTTIARRIAKALELAGVKIERKATHPLRATFASQAEASELISSKVLGRYLGHFRVHGTSTDKYIKQLVKMMRSTHREAIKLPTPDEVRALLDSFVPASTRSWKERRKPQSRTNAAKEARRQQVRRRLGASLELPDGDENGQR